MILRRDSIRANPSMGRPMRLGPSYRPDPSMGGLWDDVTGAVGSAVHTAINTTTSSIKIPYQTVQAVVTGNVSAVPGLLHQAINTIPVLSSIIPHGGGSSSPGEATGSTGATLQIATAGLTPGTPEYLAALQASGLAPAAPSSNLPLYLGGAGVLLALVLLLRPRAPQS